LRVRVRVREEIDLGSNLAPTSFLSWVRVRVKVSSPHHLSV
jgi:hypothetical protein